jgi:hypothetical protein
MGYNSSEESAASILRLEDLSSLKMKAANFFETLIISAKFPQHYNPEEYDLNTDIQKISNFRIRLWSF